MRSWGAVADSLCPEFRLKMSCQGRRFWHLDDDSKDMKTPGNAVAHFSYLVFVLVHKVRLNDLTPRMAMLGMVLLV